jgi:LAS superfamily LD-carboxypeptidase LdcB
VPASPRGYDDWATTLVDWTFTLGPDYKPPDLVSVRKGNVGGGGLVRKVVVEDLKALAAAAKANGTPLVAWSPYRTYKQQATLFNGGVSAYGYDAAITYWGRPGHSEHQLGVTIDFVAVGDTGLTSNWEVTRTGAWMAKNAWKYGWLMSYPKGKQDVVCYHYEPWHYRYYGRDLAKKIHDSGLTPREYLWANFTQVDPVTGLPLATASPSAPPASLPASSAATGGSSASGVPATASPTTANAGAPAGLQPTAVFGIILIALAAIGLVASFRFLRRRRRI